LFKLNNGAYGLASLKTFNNFIDKLQHKLWCVVDSGACWFLPLGVEPPKLWSAYPQPRGSPHRGGQNEDLKGISGNFSPAVQGVRPPRVKLLEADSIDNLKNLDKISGI
jgi:hypothetical protein